MINQFYNEKNTGQTISFTFVYDPEKGENDLLREFKKKIKSDVLYYKYKMYLRSFTKAKTWKAFLKAKHNLPEELGLDTNVVFWHLGAELYDSYFKNKNTADAIIFRAMWYVEIDYVTGKDSVKSITCYDYKADRSILTTFKNY